MDFDPSGSQDHHAEDHHVEDRYPDILKLTAKETMLLLLLGAGYTNAQIATNRGVSRETVKSNLKTLFRKLKVGDRTYAVIMALRRKLISLDQIPSPPA